MSEWWMCVCVLVCEAVHLWPTRVCVWVCVCACAAQTLAASLRLAGMRGNNNQKSEECVCAGSVVLSLD